MRRIPQGCYPASASTSELSETRVPVENVIEAMEPEDSADSGLSVMEQRFRYCMLGDLDL